MYYITRNLKQTILYWGSPTATGIGYSYADAIEILGRWEDRQEIFVDADGREHVSNAVVYLAQDVELGGYLYLGDLDEFGEDSSGLVTSDPQAVEGSYEIRAFKKTPNLKATQFERKAWL